MFGSLLWSHLLCLIILCATATTMPHPFITLSECLFLTHIHTCTHAHRHCTALWVSSHFTVSSSSCADIWRASGDLCEGPVSWSLLHQIWHFDRTAATTQMQQITLIILAFHLLLQDYRTSLSHQFRESLPDLFETSRYHGDEAQLVSPVGCLDWYFIHSQYVVSVLTFKQTLNKL